MKAWSVWVPVPVAGSFMYIYEADGLKGKRVELDFHGRKLTGYVIGEGTPKLAKKKIERIIDEKTVFGEAEVNLARFMARKYFSSPGEALHVMLPPTMKKGNITPEKPCWKPVEKISSPLLAKITSKLKAGPQLFAIYTGNFYSRTRLLWRIFQETGLKKILWLVPTVYHIQNFEAPQDKEIWAYSYKIKGTDRYWIWDMVRQEKIKIVIGSRITIFLPMNPDAIVVEDEASSHYRSPETPRWDALDIAIYKAIKSNAKLFLCGEIPSLRIYKMITEGKTSFAIIPKKLPNVKMLDTNPKHPERVVLVGPGFLSIQAVQAIRKSQIYEDSISIVLVPRAGHSVVVCNECGFIAKCPTCGVPVVLHKEDNLLHCHYCGFKKALEFCPVCGAPLKGISYGTEAVAEFLEKMFPKQIMRLDRETPQLTLRYPIVVASPRILTFMPKLEKGNVEAIAIVMAEKLFSYPNYSSREKGIQTIGKLARAFPKAPVYVEMKKEDFWPNFEDLPGLLKELLKEREKFEFPPFTETILFEVYGKTPQKSLERAIQIKEKLSSFSEELDLKAPYTPFHPVRKNMYVTYLLGKIKKRSEELYKKIMEVRKWCVVEINPEQII